MRSAAAVLLTLLAAAACNREGLPPIAPMESTSDARDGGAPAASFVAAPPSAGRDRCTARLEAAAIKTGASCTLDERISKGSGVLLYPCSGEGAAAAIFGDHRFEGNLSDGALTLTLTTELDWEDDCHWETKQTLRGELRRDTRNQRLTWSYSERPITQSTTGGSCFGSCVAKADVGVDEHSP